MSLDLINNLINDIKESDIVQSFINELNKYIAKSTNNEVISNEYSNYWLYQNFLEDAVASKIGLSRYSADITYYDDIYVATNERNNEYKKEDHIYEAIENDGYVFLNDLTEERGFIIEDIDFLIQNYEGDGKYQVIDGIYVKIDD